MANTKAKRMSIFELMALAAEDVPLGSGLQVYGRGPYHYLKTNRHDGSTRVFSFRSARMMGRARMIGIEADTEALDEDEDLFDVAVGEHGLH